jgi:hypothetical protein
LTNVLFVNSIMRSPRAAARRDRHPSRGQRPGGAPGTRRHVSSDCAGPTRRNDAMPAPSLAAQRVARSGRRRVTSRATAGSPSAGPRAQQVRQPTTGGLTEQPGQAEPGRLKHVTHSAVGGLADAGKDDRLAQPLAAAARWVKRSTSARLPHQNDAGHLQRSAERWMLQSVLACLTGTRVHVIARLIEHSMTIVLERCESGCCSAQITDARGLVASRHIVSHRTAR